ncbi:hypothetical protein PGTUg99_002130 [Puccinia graminis f. sp. tritici]|uniref:Uncharacterized protein n=1 Tax=Puccinia graminis f. sp. tritici TaxID=56615 RepID=A0A5B0SGZ3_PUCGR|nr:hypothetical protein PGTUg99_002130 [Puccinia graminis f. sp. tritici]
MPKRPRSQSQWMAIYQTEPNSRPVFSPLFLLTARTHWWISSSDSTRPMSISTIPTSKSTPSCAWRLPTVPLRSPSWTWLPNWIKQPTIYAGPSGQLVVRLASLSMAPRPSPTVGPQWCSQLRLDVTSPRRKPISKSWMPVPEHHSSSLYSMHTAESGLWSLVVVLPSSTPMPLLPMVLLTNLPITENTRAPRPRAKPSNMPRPFSI